MALEKILFISGMPGLFKLVAPRNNGVLVESLDNGKSLFVSNRQHQVLPLESIAVYTDDGESIPLRQVFRSMLEQQDAFPPVDGNASGEALKQYFAQILPNYDRERVFVSDMKKAIKWFGLLSKYGWMKPEYLADPEQETEEETTTNN